MPKASCPRLTFVVVKKPQAEVEALEQTKGFLIFAEAADPITGKKVEAGRMAVVEKIDRAGPYVSWAKANKPFERCGVGTALYEYAAKLACKEFKAPLRSDIERSAAAHSFWKKQEAKGRARCIGTNDYRVHPEEQGAVEGRDGCQRYELTCPAPRDLSGRRRSKIDPNVRPKVRR